MPTTYTHDKFGKVVFHKLPEEIRDFLKEHKMAYMIGLHGPDLLFYYKPFKKNTINQRGHRMHQETAADFFKECRYKYQETQDGELLAYVIGFICHYMLDSTCHPYIGKYIEKTGAGHDEIETELDRAIMEKYGRNPFTYRPAGILRIEKPAVEGIVAALGEISEKQVAKCLRSMRFYTGLTVCPTSLKRWFILHGMRLLGVYEETQGRVMRRQHSKRCEQSTAELLSMIRCTVPETVTIIEEFYRTLEQPEELSYRFYKNYIDGIQK